MTTLLEVDAAAPLPAGTARPPDHRGSWIPTGAMIATRIMELRKRRGLMIALVVVNIGIPIVFLVIRLLAPCRRPQVLRSGRRLRHLHRSGGRGHVRLRLHRGRHLGLHRRIGRPHRRDVPPSGGDRALAPGPLPGSIPAGLAIVVPLVAMGFTIVCAVCVFAAPTTLNYDGVDRARQSVAVRLRELGRRPRQPGRRRLPSITSRSTSPCDANAPVRRQPQRHPDCQGVSGPSAARRRRAAVLRKAAVQVARKDYRTTAASSCIRPTP